MQYDYETIQQKFCKDIVLIERHLPPQIKGLYADGVIMINKDLTDIEKACILLEAIGHHKLTHGDILNQTEEENRRQEKRARDWYAQQAITQTIYGLFRYSIKPTQFSTYSSK